MHFLPFSAQVGVLLVDVRTASIYYPNNLFACQRGASMILETNRTWSEMAPCSADNVGASC